MVTLSLLNLCFFVLIDHVKAPNSLAESAEGIPPSSQDPISNSKPTLPVVIAFLSILFWLTLTLLLYAKFCRPTSTTSSLDDTTVQIQDGLILRSRSPAASAGIDKKVVESLPFFRFSCLKGSREGLECAVCLAKFQDVEILRLLPKCKHAFHIDCIDLWLEKHSTCPLCRQGVGADDFSQLPYSDSLRFLWNIDDQLRDQESNIVELYVEREEEEENLHGSSRFSIGSISLRRLCDQKRNYKEEYLIPIQHDYSDHGGNKKACLNKLKHKINVVSDDHVVFKNRWSNVSSSDLMFLNSEMVIDSSSARFSSLDSGRNHDQRSMSEIVVHPRFSTDHELISTVAQTNVEEKRMRRLWLPIARRTVQWFADREMRHPQSQNHV